ncbi:MAG TPA: dihydrofolate reductase family protein [Candidatus Paceibacterota bacterium]|nr:dihydrofolate reductase family protein [Candidatus Paceibacterota bacterium]
MKVFIIAAMTADGFIAQHSGHLANWTSKEDKQFFIEKTKEAGVVVMGLNTYKTIGRPLPDRLNIVYSKTEKDLPGVEVTEDEPKKLIENLAKRGFKQVAITGGAQIYTMFMEAGLVDTIYFTVEPVLFGLGMGPFTKKLERKLKLEKTHMLNGNSVVLEYKVLNDKTLL